MRQVQGGRFKVQGARFEVQGLGGFWVGDGIQWGSTAVRLGCKEWFMVIEYTGRHTILTAKLKAQVEAGMKRIDLVTKRCTSAHVVLSEEKYRKIAEVNVQCRGESLVAICEAAEMEGALHDALNKVELQAIRHKERNTTVRDRPKVVAV
jgi:putative sigma-54 modulation protein